MTNNETESDDEDFTDLPIITTFEDIPGWCFALVDTDEPYEIVAYDVAGHHQLRARGTDFDEMINALRTRATQLLNSSRKPPNP
jgi:hypothetical protein